MQDGGAESQLNPASRADVGEGKGEGLAREAGGSGQASGRAGSGGGKPEGLLLGLRLLLLLTLQGDLGIVHRERTTASDSLAPGPVCAVLSHFSRV